MSPVKLVSLCAADGLHAALVMIMSVREGLKKCIFHLPLFKNIGCKVVHGCLYNCIVYSKALTPQFVCTSTVYVMTVAGNGWGESYISYTECKGSDQNCLHIWCKVLNLLCNGSHNFGSALDGV